MAYPVIEAVIPTYHPQTRFLALLRMLSHQETPVSRIHVINTDRAVMDAFLKSHGMDEKALLENYPCLDLEHIRPADFDHGTTRNRGVRKCTGASYVLLMTQDALPRDDKLTKNLLAAFSWDEKIAAVYARQLANRNASQAERISREFNYPDRPQIKSQADFSRLGIKTYFCSNVCAMYRMDVWQALGGFPDHMIFNEDMVFAGHALQQGWKIAYAPEACVFHSHNYTAAQQFHRNFDLGVSQADHPEIFAGTGSEGEGVHYVKNVVSQLGQRGAAGETPAFILSCACRFAGYRLGKSYRKLPKALVRDFSGSRYYWDR